MGPGRGRRVLILLRCGRRRRTNDQRMRICRRLFSVIAVVENGTKGLSYGIGVLPGWTVEDLDVR